MDVQYQPLTSAHWKEFEILFGPKGAHGGCWCMWWRVTRAEFEQGQGEANRVAMKEIVDSGGVPGLLFYLEGIPAAWCAVAPREEYAALNRSRVLKPIDDAKVWSLVCFFVGKEYRRQGMIQPMLQGVIDFVGKQGGKIIEAYPKAAKDGRQAPVSIFMGLPSMYEKAGFMEVARPSKSRLVMRYFL